MAVVERLVREHGRGAAHSQTRGRGKVGAGKPEIEPLPLGFGSAVSNGGRERWW